MEPNAPSGGGAVIPNKTNLSSTGGNASKPPQPSKESTPPQKSAFDKGKSVACSSGKPPIAPSEKGKPATSSASKKGKSTSTSGKKRKKVTNRKPDANKQVGIQTRRRSPAWDIFRKVPEDEVDEPTAECIYCGIRFLCGSKEHGTSNMLAHIPKCPKQVHTLSNDPKQKILEFERKSSGKQLAGSIPHVVDLKECRKGIAFFVLCDEQPFKVVEGFGFQYMCKKLCPRLEVPSRKTIATDCMKIYEDEKCRLKGLLRSDCVRVSLTTDCWTSVQNLNYLCLTAHFVDNEWNLQKRILSFTLVPNHKGETIGKTIEACLQEWGLKRVFSITVDNATSNDTAIAYLKKKMRNWGGLMLDGDMMHMRCCAHIMNLVVNEGLKDYHASIASIRSAVRYVRSSPSRQTKFKEAAEAENIASNAMVCLDVPTRWNSTYKMLDSAVIFQKAFERLEEDDRDFQLHFLDSEKKGGPPRSEDWENARSFINFLKIFYDVTLSFSSSLNVTSNIAFNNLALVQSQLKSWTSLDNLDSVLYFMATDMKVKFNKYWGLVETMNPILFIANCLDPRYKLAYIAWSFEEIYGEELARDLVKNVKASLIKVYDWYAKEYGKPSTSGGVGQSAGEASKQSMSSCESHALKARNAAFRSHLKKKDTIEAQNELERYLNEACYDEQQAKKFDVLAWWKMNESRFEVLSKLARDFLAVPVSTVASESAFSTGGRVLDVFRSSLAPKTAEALICTQNWLKSSKDINEEKDMVDDIDCFEDMDIAASAAPTEGGDGAPGTSTSGGGNPTDQISQPMAVD